MKSTLKLIRRFLMIVILSIFLLLIMNLILLFVISGPNIGNKSPWTAADEVAAALVQQGDGTYVLSGNGKNVLSESGAWAILIEDKSGSVIWHSANLPDDIPMQYSLSSLAWAVRGYIKDYPTTTSSYGNHILVLGNPKTSLWKLMWNTFDYQMIANMPRTILVFLFSNFALLLIIYLAATTGVLRSVKPIVQGIETLPDGGNVYIKEKGLFSQLAKSINQASERLRNQEYRLKKKETARANWIAGVSHDIRTPLSMVLGYASQLEESPNLSAEERQKASIIRLQSVRIKNLINDLNLSSKLEYNAQPVNRNLINAVSLLRHVVVDFINMDPNGIYPMEWATANTFTRCMVKADERLLRRALSNLIINAQVHNPNGCMITAKISEIENWCCMTIWDNGIGVEEKQLEALRNSPHYMFCDSSTSEQRHGLGLLIVKQIAEAHGGKLELGHSPEGGFSASILLPVSGKASDKP